jgi:NAD(P)-dependent dehydrogenase (short-subunit alcohol dehydrogenase family)
MGKVLIITGGSRGIGAATAILAAQRGYTVCVNYRANRSAAERVVKAVEAAGARAVAVAADVSVESDVMRWFETCDKVLGAPTALANNAGILETQMRVETMDAARLQRVFATNVIGSFICAREAVRRMSTKHGGAGGK